MHVISRYAAKAAAEAARGGASPGSWGAGSQVSFFIIVFSLCIAGCQVRYFPILFSIFALYCFILAGSQVSFSGNSFF